MYNGLFSLIDLSEQLVSFLGGNLGVWYHVLYNAVGVISIAIQFMIFQMKNRRSILIVGIFSHLGFMTYFCLQGEFISSVGNIIGIISSSIFLMRNKYKWANSNLWIIFFLAVGATFSILTFKTWKDIFPMLGCLSSMTAFFMIKEENIIKTSFFTYIFFMCNSISKFLIVALIADVTAFISVIISLIVLKKNNQSVSPKKTE